jgi:AcrR family transcriptional regulator
MHRGKLLERVVKSSAMPVKQVVSAMHLSRMSFYNHVKDKDLSLAVLQGYGRAMGYDFSRDLTDIRDVEQILGIEPLTLEEAILQADAWRDRFFQLLEEFHAYLDDVLLFTPCKES